MNTYRIALFGHRDLYSFRRIEEKLSTLVSELLRTKAYTELYIGRNGDFDTLAASTIKRVQKDIGYQSSELILVLPYSAKDITRYEHLYDSILIPEVLSGVYPKAAITKRNRFMIDLCDLCICFVEHEYGGAYTALKYAKKQGKTVINLATDPIGDGY